MDHQMRVQENRNHPSGISAALQRMTRRRHMELYYGESAFE